MNTLKPLVAIADGDGSLFAADVIWHGGKYWMVPNWAVYPTEGYQQPERIICLDTLKHQKTKRGTYPADFVGNGPIPKSVLYGSAPPAANSGYVVTLQPDIRVPIPRGIH
jgi:hypothetical protein